MSPGPEDAGGRDAIGEADRVLLMALIAWAPARREARLLDRLGPSWARRLIEGTGGGEAGPPAVPGDRAGARKRLQGAHRAEARVDLSRVHPSWWARGMREESPTVRRAVVAAAPGPIRARLQAELLLDDDDLRADRPADPEVLAWACALWTERLVGGEDRGADDPPVIEAMSALSPRAGYRLCRHAGELKFALAGQAGAPDWAAHFAATAGPEFVAIARHDLRATAMATAKLPPRRRAARVGLLTVARLLAVGEPFRVRWALQLWPYPIAKLIRALMPPAEKRSPVMMQVETDLLRAARERVDRDDPVASE